MRAKRQTTKNNSDAQRMTAANERSGVAAEGGSLPVAAPWWLTSRVTIPRRVDGYLRRPQVLSRCQPLNRRLTLFHAPCGFGKTTLLTDICRRERERGVLTAWLRLDRSDTFDVLATYIGHALEHAGLDVPGPQRIVPNAGETHDRPADVDHRIGVLLRAIENYRIPCLFALDEVDVLVDGEQIRLIDFLLRRAPRNLHFAMTMRHSPPGLDLASTVVDGRGTILRTDDLRFTKPEVALYFGGRLSRSELAEMTEVTEGWPAALRINLNARTAAAMSGNGGRIRGPAEDYTRVEARFLASRLRRDMTDDEVDYLRDISLFDCIDPTMVEEVLPGTHSKLGARALAKIQGLVQPVDASGTLRLHRAVQQYCAARRFEMTPQRFRMLHRRIATAMARRGRLDSALGHTAHSGDHNLIGEILESAGGVRLWFTHGMKQLQEWDRILTREVVAAFPRLALLRCAAFAARSDPRQTPALLENVRDRTSNFRRDRDGGDDAALRVDSIVVRATLAIAGCQPLGSEIVGDVLADAARLATDEQFDPVSRSLLNMILCIADYQRARFASSQWLGTQARQTLVIADTRYGAALNDFHLGMLAMAEGRVEEAARSYARHAQTMVSQILTAELDLERNRPRSHRRVASKTLLRIAMTSLDVYAAAYGVIAESAAETKGAMGAVRALEDALDFANAQGLTSVVRHLSALRVSYLVIKGRVAQANRVWRDARLPECESGLLDLDRQSWREMEAISCARIRLLEARHEIEAARRLAERLRGVARERGLMRTRMRCVALWMGLEYRSGNANAAAARLLEFLRLLRVTDYERPLARECEVSRELLPRVLGTVLEPELRSAAESALNRLGGPPAGDAGKTPTYTARELEVIAHVARGLRDKQVARHLGLTEHGVRYHLKNVFRKIGATSRMDAARRARTLGIIPRDVECR